MPKYRVTKAYNHDVQVGDMIETKNLHPSLLSHVVLADSETASLEVATPKAPTAAELKKQAAELKKQQEAKEKEIKDSDAPPGEAPADPAPTFVPDQDGPGENS